MTRGNQTSEELRSLAARCDETFPDAAYVGIDNSDTLNGLNTLIISVEGPDKQAVASRATEIAKRVRSMDEFVSHGKNVRVERMTNDDYDGEEGPQIEYYDVLVALNEQ